MPVDIIMVSGPGGHLNTARQLVCEMALPLTIKYVVHDCKTKEIDGIEVINIIHSDRDWRIIVQFISAFRIMKRLRPRVVISTGAGIGIPFAFASKLLGCKFIHVETFSAAGGLTLSGKLISKFTKYFYVRYKRLAEKYGFIYVE